MRPLELLAPAKNFDIGKAAIDHGADAVYIGAPRFGARAAAGNSIADIRELCDYAHRFGAKVYVTVNTIIYDEELEETKILLDDLYEAQVDAVLVQDMGIIQYSTIPLHASTQTDNRTAEKVAWLCSQGFRRVVLARELSIDEIAAIHRQVPDVELEVFVHGALCVSYSGLCYASQHCFQRSANRGECAQFCRMKFDLLDADGQLIEKQKYLLSLKDMNQYANLEALAEAGATSFKIEGRLKDAVYVKNVTAAYNEQLNHIVEKYPDRYFRPSKGNVKYSFAPNLDKSFNRGYTTYFAQGRQKNIASFDTPKAIGERVGVVKEVRGSYLTVAGVASFANGDGLCFFDEQHQLQGFRVNRVEGNKLFPLQMPRQLHTGLPLFRNNDQVFERMLNKLSAERKIPVELILRATSDGFSLTMKDVTVQIPYVLQVAQKPQRENIISQLSKFGGTCYECVHVDIPEDFNYFIPSSKLVELRRAVVEKYEQCQRENEEIHVNRTNWNTCPLPHYSNSYCYNIANRNASEFYSKQGLKYQTMAFELQEPKGEVLIMQCRHCLRYALGFCVKNGGQRPLWKEPLYLRLSDGQQFRLEFDCRQCQMNVYASNR